MIKTKTTSQSQNKINRQEPLKWVHRSKKAVASRGCFSMQAEVLVDQGWDWICIFVDIQ